MQAPGTESLLCILNITSRLPLYDICPFVAQKMDTSEKLSIWTYSYSWEYSALMMVHTFRWLTSNELHPCARWDIFVHYYWMDSEHPCSQCPRQFCCDRQSDVRIVVAFKCLTEKKTAICFQVHQIANVLLRTFHITVYSHSTNLHIRACWLSIFQFDLLH